MKTILKITTILFVFIGSFSSCGKDEDIDMSKIDFNNIRNLYAQPLPVIQKCVQGKWQNKGTYGGIAGWNPNPDNIFVKINGNKINNNEFQWKKYTVQNPDGSLFATHAIQYIGVDEPAMYFISIENDSLSVGYFNHSNCFDCFTGALWVRIE